MHAFAVSRSSVLLGSVLLAAAGVDVGKAIAQSPAVCQPPKAGEYLVLVSSPTEAAQSQLRENLPSSATATVCTYLEDVVLRVGGFSSAETANDWAQYVDEVSGLQAFVARPPATLPPASSPDAAITPPDTTPPASTPAPAVPAAPAPSAEAPAADSTSTAFPQPDPSTAPPAVTPPVAAVPPAVPSSTAPANTAPQASPQTVAYNPQPLGVGYAVLVDYANRPEVAAAVREVLARDIGLVAYGQRPYLLAVYTEDPTVSNTTLRTLSDRNFVAMIVDGRRAVLLTTAVRY